MLSSMLLGADKDEGLAVARRLARVIAQHTDGKGLGISYEPFDEKWTVSKRDKVRGEWDIYQSIPLPDDFVAALRAAGFGFDPRGVDDSGWRRYVTLDGRFTVAVEGWGDHCIGAEGCSLPNFKNELKLRLQEPPQEPVVAVLWSRKIPLQLTKDRWGNGMRPLDFKAISFVVLEGSRPIDPRA